MTRRKKIVIVSVVTAVAVVILGGLSLAPKEDLSNADGLFKAIDKQTKQTFSNIYTTYGSDWFAQMGTGIPADVEGFDFKMNSQAAPTLNFGFGDERPDTFKKFFFFTRTPKHTDSLTDANEVIDSVMARAGFTKTVGENNNVFYDKQGATCVLATSNDGVLTLSCSTPLIFNTLATDAKPFVDEYQKANPGIAAKDIAFGPLDIKDDADAAKVITASKSSGYQIAEALVTVNDKEELVLYYRKTTTPWMYVTKADDEYGFRCGDYQKDADMRKAFYDQICLSETGHVRLDTNNRALQ